jgi:hypothetical protein
VVGEVPFLAAVVSERVVATKKSRQEKRCDAKVGSSNLDEQNEPVSPQSIVVDEIGGDTPKARNGTAGSKKVKNVECLESVSTPPLAPDKAPYPLFVSNPLAPIIPEGEEPGKGELPSPSSVTISIYSQQYSQDGSGKDAGRSPAHDQHYDMFWSVVSFSHAQFRCELVNIASHARFPIC